jgi:hypothetical protein
MGRTAIESAVGATRASYVDVTRYLCGAQCPPIIGATLVYRDANHLTATFSAELAPALGAELGPVLAPALAAGHR